MSDTDIWGTNVSACQDKKPQSLKMSSEDEMERRLSEVGKRVNDSPGHGKKKSNTKTSNTIPAGTAAVHVVP